MSLLVEAIRPSLVPGIFATKGPFQSQSISDVLMHPASSYVVGVGSVPRSFNIEFSDPAYLTHIIACDSRRLSMSCIQSATSAWEASDEKMALPWSLIRLYYAAFYAAHVVSRLVGEACCWFDSAHISRVDNIYRAVSGVSLPARPDAGSYRCVADSTGRILQCARVSSAGRGAHEALWSVFDAALVGVSAKALRSSLTTRDAQSVVAKLDEFRSMSTRHKSSSWLSRTRNELQYRLEHGAWYPCEFTKRERELLQKVAESWQQDPMAMNFSSVAGRGHLLEFALACSFILAIFRSLIARIDSISSNKSSSFVRLGPAALANHSHVSLV